MATYNLTPKDIYDAEFDVKMRGYDKDQVNDLLDEVIVDYEKFQEEILSLQEENEFLKKKFKMWRRHLMLLYLKTHNALTQSRQLQL